MLKGLKSFLKEVVKDLPIDVGVNMAMDAMRKGVEKTIATNPRADVMKVLVAMGNSPAVATILNRLRVAEATAEPGYENDLIIAFGGVLPRDKEGRVEEDKAKKIYEWIGGLSDEDFAVFTHGMQHDPYYQRLRMAWRNAKVGEKLDKTGELVDDALDAWYASARKRGFTGRRRP